VRTHDGRVLQATVTDAKGSLAHPLTDLEIETKVRDLAQHGAFRGSIDEVIAAAWRVDEMETLDPLVRCCVGVG
jgi:hypothetical protein